MIKFFTIKLNNTASAKTDEKRVCKDYSNSAKVETIKTSISKKGQK